MLNLHEHEVGGGVEVRQADEGEVVVEAVQGCWHEVEAKHLFLVDNHDFVVHRQYGTSMTGDMVGIRSGERSTPSYS